MRVLWVRWACCCDEVPSWEVRLNASRRWCETDRASWGYCWASERPLASHTCVSPRRSTIDSTPPVSCLPMYTAGKRIWQFTWTLRSNAGYTERFKWLRCESGTRYWRLSERHRRICRAFRRQLKKRLSNASFDDWIWCATDLYEDTWQLFLPCPCCVYKTSVSAIFIHKVTWRHIFVVVLCVVKWWRFVALFE